jgi:hypothetical protein
VTPWVMRGAPQVGFSAAMRQPFVTRIQYRKPCRENRLLSVLLGRGIRNSLYCSEVGSRGTCQQSELCAHVSQYSCRI